MGFTKYGICYNIFDGQELLKDSILQIRDLVEFISVVYQTESYWGNKCSENLIEILNDLKNEGLIDELVFYENQQTLSPHSNQIIKRNIGINLSRKKYCTHHMSMDCDEFYVEEQFAKLLAWYDENPNFVGFADYNDYYKSSSYLIDKPHDTMVSLFFPIKGNNVSFIQDYPSPVLVDPTRRPNYDRYVIFQPDVIQMHHMTLVRKNIDSKIRNAAKRLNYDNDVAIQKQIDYYNNWNEDNLVGLNEWGFLKLKKIEPIIMLSNYDRIIK
jgi:hypothetical protein